MRVTSTQKRCIWMMCTGVFTLLKRHMWPTWQICSGLSRMTHGVATSSRLLKMIGLCCKRDLYNRRYSAQETYNFKEPTNRSYPISKSLKRHTVSTQTIRYGVTTISMLLKMIGLFCKRALLKRRYSAKETCNREAHMFHTHDTIRGGYE